jgi:hypothetical protein
MNAVDLEESPAPRSPRTATVLIFFAAFAIIISWLACYALTNALIAASILTPWPHDADPRWRWMLNSFGGLFISFIVLGGFFRWVSNRQLRRIDAIADAE